MLTLRELKAVLSRDARIMSLAERMAADADTERRRVRELVSGERLALVRIGLMHNHNDGSWCKPELAYGHPARAERRRQIIILAGAARVRRKIESSIEHQELMFALEMYFAKLPYRIAAIEARVSAGAMHGHGGGDQPACADCGGSGKGKA